MRKKWKWGQFERTAVITKAADYMIDNKATLLEVEDNLGMPHSSMWWYIHNVLPYIDYDKAVKCKALLKYHKYHKRRNSK